MQTITQNPSEATPSLMIELFSRFLSRLLEKEAKYNVFTEQWETFKTLLTQAPFDLDKIYIHLARIQLNLEKINNPAVETSYKSKLGNETIRIITPTTGSSSTTKLGVDISKAASPVTELSFTSKLGADTFKPISPRIESPFGSNLIGDTSRDICYLDPKLEKSPRSNNKRRSRTTNGITDFAISANVTPCPSQLEDQSKDLENKVPVLKDFETLFEVPKDFVRQAKTRPGTVITQRAEIPNFSDSPKTKYDVTFLASKARRLKETVEVHSKLVVEANEKGPKSYLIPNMAERTPLRGLILYAKQGDGNGSLSAKNQQGFSEQVNLESYSHRPSLPVNQMAPYY